MLHSDSLILYNIWMISSRLQTSQEMDIETIMIFTLFNVLEVVAEGSYSN